ncbi:MAG: PEP-CTERM sorting domain-containing protein [Phycisphaerales bacterium]|nr:PEP-CTERM sorting domain-containing protein [Phycisphaerales bacterium]
MASSAAGALETANWVGGGAAGSYNDPLNWNLGVVPVNGVDTYIVNLPASTVDFNVPGSGHQVFQLNLPLSGILDINAGRDLEVLDAAAISGVVTAVNGQFLAGHASSSFGGNKSTVNVDGGGEITLGGATYSSTGLVGGANLFTANSTGSKLNLPNLTSINGALSTHVNIFHAISATNGGAIDMSALTSVSGPTYETIDRLAFIVDSGGAIDLSSLATTNSGSGMVRFDVRDTSGGAFTLPSLVTSDDAEFIVASGLTADLGTAGTPASQSGGAYTLADGAIVNYTPLTTLQWTSIDLAINSELHVPNVVDISGSNVTLAPGRVFDTGVIGTLDNARIAVTGGVNWGVATGDLSATSYSCVGLTGAYTIFSASDPGSVLDLSTINSINAAHSTHVNLLYSVKASNGGAIDLSGLTNVSGPTYEVVDRIEFVVESGGTIDLSNLATTTSGAGKVRFDVRDTSGGPFALPSLQTSNDAEFIVAGGLTIDLGTDGNPAAQSGGSFTLGDNAVVNYIPLTTLQWASVSLGVGSELHMPNLTNMDGSAVTMAPGRTFDTGVIGSLDNARIAVTGGANWGAATGDLSASSYSCVTLNGVYTIFSASDPGSVLDLSTINSINAARSHHTNLVYSIKASNGGTVDLSGVTSIAAPTYEVADRIEFVASTGGTIDLTSLQTVTAAGAGYTQFTVQNAGKMLFGDMPHIENTRINVADLDSILDINGSVQLTSGSFTVAGGATVSVSGNFAHEYTDETTMQAASAILHMDGAGTFANPQLLEVAGLAAGLGDPGNNGNFGFGQLVIGTSGQPTVVSLIDVFDNGNRASPEALYLFGLGGPDGLLLQDGSTLVIGEIPVYAMVDGDWMFLNDLFTGGITSVDFGALTANPADAGFVVVPEPATLTLLGLGGLAIIRRKRRA